MNLEVKLGIVCYTVVYIRNDSRLEVDKIDGTKERL